jgi:hypothetical protein
MKRLLLYFVFAVLAASFATAQDQDDSSKSKSDVRTITGCLSNGDSANEVLLKADDGSTWEIHNNSQVQLTNHVGHQVSVTGTVSNATAHNLKEDAKDAAADTGMKKDNTEHGHLKATDVQMVSDTCKQ